MHDAKRHLKYIKDQNIDIFKEKKKQSQRAKEKNEAKRTAEKTAAYGQALRRKAPLVRSPEPIRVEKQHPHLRRHVLGLMRHSLPVEIVSTLGSG